LRASSEGEKEELAPQGEGEEDEDGTAGCQSSQKKRMEEVKLQQ
jgi:hypothetical protein